uniref:Dipeptidylpeptidase IV N-terminal domain-containing protein n=1 Tax=Timema poppense TaxID=170557 RepID=A0A7R9D4W8_TIMPO|nr:unnamed protein product [Timema poppensis]
MIEWIKASLSCQTGPLMTGQIVCYYQLQCPEYSKASLSCYTGLLMTGISRFESLSGLLRVAFSKCAEKPKFRSRSIITPQKTLVYVLQENCEMESGTTNPHVSLKVVDLTQDLTYDSITVVDLPAPTDIVTDLLKCYLSACILTIEPVGIFAASDHILYTVTWPTDSAVVATWTNRVQNVAVITSYNSSSGAATIFSGPEPLFFHSSSSSFVLTRLSYPITDPLLIRKAASAGTQTPDTWICIQWIIEVVYPYPCKNSMWYTIPKAPDLVSEPRLPANADQGFI